MWCAAPARPSAWRSGPNAWLESYAERALRPCAHRRRTFHPLPPPTDEEVEAITVRIVRRVAHLLARHDEGGAGDEEVDALGQAQAESTQLPLALSEPVAPTTRSTRRRTVLVDGFSLHANISVDGADRAGL